MVKDIPEFHVSLINDTPEHDATLLGHDEVVENLKNFIESGEMITPLSVAIHGEWGSGKTSVMRTLESKLDPAKFKIVFFEAWKYEYSNPAIGLINELLKGTKDANKVISILSIATGIFLKHYTGVDFGDIRQLVKTTRDAPESFSEQFESTLNQLRGTKKIVVIIDDLDRCDVENTLQILALLKLFLGIKNVICIVAIDYKRIQQAWHHKYGVEKTTPKTEENNFGTKDEGRDYLDKIFQLRIGIPIPTAPQVKDYVKKLLPDSQPEIIEMISYSATRNPRAIKKLINLISYRGSIIKNKNKSSFAYETACIWSILEDNLGHDGLIHFWKTLRINKTLGVNTLGELILQYGKVWKPINKFISEHVPLGLRERANTEKVRILFLEGHRLCDFHKINKDALNENLEILFTATNESTRFG